MESSRIQAILVKRTRWQCDPCGRRNQRVPHGSHSWGDRAHLSGLPPAKPTQVEVAPMPQSIKQQLEELTKKVAVRGSKTK